MMKKYLLLLLSIGAVSGWVHAQDKFPKHYTQAEKIETLSRIWSELKYNFVYADRLTFNQDSLYAAYIPQVLATQDDVAFFDLLKRYMARFGDGHTQVVRYSYNWNDVYDYAPMMVEELDGKYYLSEIWESSGLDSTALGAEIVRIEGIPTRDYVETHYFPYLAAGSEAAKYRLAANEIGTGLPGSKFRAELLYVTAATVRFKSTTITIVAIGSAGSENRGHGRASVPRPDVWQRSIGSKGRLPNSIFAVSTNE